jgi:hypothetical protein
MSGSKHAVQTWPVLVSEHALEQATERAGITDRATITATLEAAA